MELYHKVTKTLSELEIVRLLKIYPPETYVPYDPTRTSNQRILKNSQLPYTDLYIFKNREEELKVYSSNDMSLISKDTLISYVANSINLKQLNDSLERQPYPYFYPPKEALIIEEGQDLTATILSLESMDDDDYNVSSSTHGDTYPLYYDNKIANFLFISQNLNTWSTFNSKPGLHHTYGIKQAESIVINFDPMLCLQNDPDEHAFITVPYIDSTIHNYLRSVLESMGTDMYYNLHTAHDYLHFTNYLLNSHKQINEKLHLYSVTRNGLFTETLIGFKTPIDNLKKRTTASKLNEEIFSNYNYDQNTRSYQEKQLNIPEENRNNYFHIKSEIVGDMLKIKFFHVIDVYQKLLELFFEPQPIQKIGASVS